MQYLKEHLKDKILEVAESVYYDEGYDKANLRVIAARCGITVGNLYRYFANKEALLDAVLKPLLDEVEFLVSDLLSEKTLHDRRQHEQFHIKVADRLSALTQKYHKQVSILISGVSGTKYGPYFQILVHRIAEGMQEVVAIAKPFLKLQPIIYEVLAKNHVEGIVYIITQVSDPAEQQVAIRQFLDVHLHYFEAIKEEV